MNSIIITGRIKAIFERNKILTLEYGSEKRIVVYYGKVRLAPLNLNINQNIKVIGKMDMTTEGIDFIHAFYIEKGDNNEQEEYSYNINLNFN